MSSIVLPIGHSAAYSATLFENYLERITADPNIVDLMTRGDPVATVMPEDDYAAGGNDDLDGSLLARVAPQSADDTAPMRSAQSYAGPIGAVSSSGGALDGTAGGGAGAAGGAVSDLGGALGGLGRQRAN